jgi:3,4-dihydroxy-2-butanone 4-phosphate synthase
MSGSEGAGRSNAPGLPDEGRVLRIETVVNDPTDLGVLRRLGHVLELQAKARDVNRRVLDHEYVGQGCVLASRLYAARKQGA